MYIDIIKVLSDLKEACHAAHCSLTQLCKEAGVSRAVVTSWEYGGVNPSVRIINKLFDTAKQLQEKLPATENNNPPAQ